MDPRSGSGRTNDNPPVRWPPFFTTILEQIVAKVNWWPVILEQFLAFWMLKKKEHNSIIGIPFWCHRSWFLTYIAITAIKNVERAVIIRSPHVIDVVFHFHFDRVALIVFAAFELLVSVLFRQPFQGPFVAGGPVILAAQNDHRFVRIFELGNELLGRDVFHVDALNGVIHVVVGQVEGFGKFLLSPQFSRAQFCKNGYSLFKVKSIQWTY